MNELSILITTAITIACLHTLTGPDHYLPFIALSRARGWSASKTIGWTILCGSGHVISSVLLGLGGAALGWSLAHVGWLEEVRGGWAGWLMLIFGVIYLAWGLYRAAINRPHKHFETGDGDDIYVYEHKHGAAAAPRERHKVTPWVMFLIFILGPCEPMIPLLYYPAAKNSWMGMGILILVYLLFTLLTMLALVMAGYFGLGFTKTGKWERYMHALGGLTICTCGAGMVFLSW